MREVCGSGGVGEVPYGVEALVFAREGIKFCHEGGDIADHAGANCSDRWMRTATEHVVLSVVFPTEWTGERGRVLICGALDHLGSMKVPVISQLGHSCTFSI